MRGTKGCFVCGQKQDIERKMALLAVKILSEIYTVMDIDDDKGDISNPSEWVRYAENRHTDEESFVVHEFRKIEENE